VEAEMTDAKALLRAGCLVLGIAAGAAAQPAPVESNVWSRGTTAGLFGGVASASSDSGLVLGSAAGWEVTRWVGIEGSVAWLDRRGSGEAFAATLAAHANLTSRRPIVPFVKGEIGLYRMTAGPGLEDIPEFYRRRLGPGDPSMTGVGSQTFTDPSVVLGGGVNVFATRHLAIRPELTAAIVQRQGRSHVVTAVVMQIAYHFEEHAITPGR
jgi:hypothetical protein